MSKVVHFPLADPMLQNVQCVAKTLNIFRHSVVIPCKTYYYGSSP